MHICVRMYDIGVCYGMVPFFPAQIHRMRWHYAEEPYVVSVFVADARIRSSGVVSPPLTCIITITYWDVHWMMHIQRTNDAVQYVEVQLEEWKLGDEAIHARCIVTVC